jgi:ribosomal-protein-alanine N-acetyltransferase
MSHITRDHHLQLVIEPAKLEDLDEIAAIENRAYPFPWSRSVLRAEIDGKEFSFVYVARMPHDSAFPEKIIGYIFFWLVSDDVHILNVAVDPDYRGYGCGKLMMQFVLDFSLERGARSAFLEVRSSNADAQQFYTCLGFRPVGIKRHYYSNNKEDAYVMKKRLCPF